MRKEEQYIAVIANLLSGVELDIIKSLGYKSLLINSNTWISLERALQADAPVEVNLNNEEEVLEKVNEIKEKFNIVAVFSFNEYRVPIAAKIRELLGLPYGIPYQAAINCRNKKNTRKILEELGTDAVKYGIIVSLEEAKQFVEQNGFPVVIKPSNDAGSINIFCCRNEDDVVEAVQKIQETKCNLVDQALDQEFLIEEFLDGPEFSVESVAYQGKIEVIAITEKKIISPFQPIEIGHTVPANIKEKDVNAIKSLVIRANELLGIDYTVTHTEVKLTSGGPRIVEVNARIGGDNIASLVEAVKGVNLYESSILLALGKDIRYKEPVANRASIRYFYAEEDGYAEVKDLTPLKNNSNVKEISIDVQNGDKMVKTFSNYNRYGYFLCYDESDQYLDEMIKLVRSNNQGNNYKDSTKETESSKDYKFQEVFGAYLSSKNVEATLGDREHSIVRLVCSLFGSDDYLKVKEVIKTKFEGVSAQEISEIYEMVLKYKMNNDIK